MGLIAFLKSELACYELGNPSPSEVLTPQVVTGKRSGAQALASNLTLGIALDALAQTSLGFHRFEPVIGIVSPLPWAILLTRQGISLP